MTHKYYIKEALKTHGAMCDDCLSEETKIKPRQSVNIACRALTVDGVLVRSKDVCPRCRGIKLINRFKESPALVDHDETKKSNLTPYAKEPVRTHDVKALSEDEIKQVLVDWLSKDGWKTTVAWGNARGIDIEATRGKERWVIEVKGPGSRQPMRVNYFIGILGEILQRMDDPDARYSIAFPDLQQYRGLWDRLPSLAKSRTKISIIFVSMDGEVDLGGDI